MKIFCIKCRNENLAEAKFCGKCGQKLNAVNFLENDDEISKADIKNTEEIRKTEYYAIPTNRFILYSILSFGIFNFFWFYNNWVAVKKNQSEESDIYPFWRAWFSIFFSFSLFKKVLTSAKANGYSESYDPSLLGIIYFVGTLLDRAISKMEIVNEWYILIFLFGWFIVPLIFIPVQNAINYNNKKINEDFKFQKIGPIGIIFVVFGSIFSLLALIGLFG